MALIKKYENSTPTGDIRLIRSGYLTIQERDASNQVVNEYTWGKNMGGGIGGLLNLRQGGNDYNYLYDGRGNVSALLNTTQQVAASYRYDAFGNLMAKTGTLDQPYMFSTKRYDAGTGLSYYGYRFYNPAIGKWLTRDPIGEAGGINLYGYVLNDPVNAVDPYGLYAWPYTWKGWAGVILVPAGVGFAAAGFIPEGAVLIVAGVVFTAWDLVEGTIQAEVDTNASVREIIKAKIGQAGGNAKWLQEMGMIPSNDRLKDLGFTDEELREFGLLACP